MKDLTGQINGVTTLPDDDFNEMAQEAKNFIEDVGPASDTGDLDQWGKSAASYSMRAAYMADTGTSTAYVVGPNSGYQGPHSLVTGLEVRFLPTNVNTTTNPTLAMNGEAAKNILSEEGGAIEVGDIHTSRYANMVYDGTAFRLLNSSLSSVPAGHFDGFLISNGTDSINDLDVAAGGHCADSTNQLLMKQNAAMTKRIDAVWAAGTGNGGFPSTLSAGSPVDGTWYRYFAIHKTADGTIDYGWDSVANADASLLLTDAGDYSAYIQVGWMKYVAAAGVIFIQDPERPDHIIWDVPGADSQSVAASTTAANREFDAPPGATAVFSVTWEADVVADTAMYGLVTRLDDQTNTLPASDAFNFRGHETDDHGHIMTQVLEVVVDDSSEVRIRASKASGDIITATTGYIYNRGK